MKNLKKVLSLVLAATMAMSLMATSAFAKDEAYADADKVNYNEAVDVMSAAGVFQGSNGEFNPQGDLTRESAAKIITYMLMGKANADQLKAGEAPYADVAADRWSAGAISYCTAQGIVAGSNGKFMPTQKVTGVQFAKMLLVALGYDAKIEKMVGPSWAIYTSTLAVAADLNTDMEDVLLSAPLTREQAAQMAFNTMKADVVKYANKGTEIKLADGTTVMMGATPAETVELKGSNYAYDAQIADLASQGKDTQQFVEKYFKDLQLVVGGKDDMGRPADVWNLKSEKVGTYGNAADYTFVATEDKNDANQTLEALVEDVNKNLEFAAKGLTVMTNGQGSGNAATKPAAGSTVELYLNDAGKIQNVAITAYSVDEVTAAVTTKVKDDVDYISIPGITKGYVKADTIVGAAGLVEDDVVLTYTDKAGVTTIKKAASVKGVVTGDHAKNGLQVNGTFYDKTSKTANADVTAWSNDFKNTYTFYLDDANAIVKAVKETNEATNNYAAVVDVAWVAGSGINGTNYVEAKIVKPDATTEIVKIASVDGVKAIAKNALVGADLYYWNSSDDAKTTAETKAAALTYYYEKNEIAENADGVKLTAKSFGVADTASLTANKSIVKMQVNGSSHAFEAGPATEAFITLNSIYNYEINKDGEYELSTTATDDTFAKLNAKIESKNPAIGATANDKTVFVYATKEGDDTVYTAYTGIKNAPEASSLKPVANTIVVNKDGFATFVFVDVVTAGTVTGTADKDLVYVADYTDYTTMKNGDDEYVVYNAIVNGVAQEIKLTEAVKNDGMYYVKSADAKGYKTLATITAKEAVNMVGINRVGGGAFVTGDPDKELVENEYATMTYAYNDKTVAYFINEDGESTEMKVEALSKDATDLVWVVTETAEPTLATEIYVVEKDQQAKSLKVAAAEGGKATQPDLYKANAAVTGATLGTTTLTVTAEATPGMKYTVAVKGNGTNAVEKTGTSETWGAQAANDEAYKTVAAGKDITADSVITVTVTAEDEFSGLSAVYTYTFTIAAA